MRPPASAVETPIDMTMYADPTRLRGEALSVVPMGAAPSSAAMDRFAVPRLTLARRPLVDLPVPAMPPTGPEAARHGESSVDGGSAFDVPAFLRRQEG